MVRTARTMGVASVVAALLAVSADGRVRAQVHSEFPALARPFTSESFSTQPADLRDRLADRGFSVEAAALRLSQGARRGGAGPGLSNGDPGGRLAIQYRHGRYAATAEAIEDGPRAVEPREYPVRVVASSAWPEAGVFTALAGGFDGAGFAGADLALECAPLTLRMPVLGCFPADSRPRLVTWVRSRLLARSGGARLEPAAALVLDHLPVLASELVLAPSFQSEWRAGEAPASVLLLQVAYSAGPWPLGGGGGVIRRGSPPPSTLLGGLFVHAGYARPLDERSRARFVVGVGTDLDVVLRSAWPTSE
jgi:hypothetical protein